MNLSRGEIWHAINNDSNDDLGEDEDYRKGVMGDVIDVENMSPDINPSGQEAIKKEEEDEVSSDFDATDNESYGHLQSSELHCLWIWLHSLSFSWNFS